MSSVNEYRLGGKKLPVPKVVLGSSDSYEATTNKYHLHLAGGRNSLDMDETSYAKPPRPQLWTRMRKHASRLSRPTEDTNHSSFMLHVCRASPHSPPNFNQRNSGTQLPLKLHMGVR